MYRIMIVEDEYIVRKGISSLINFENFKMTISAEAENGLEAWELFQKEPVDILLTDINMPHMNGIHLAKLIREHYPATHIVFLTGYDDFEYALSAVKIGADDYLLKPFSKSDVEEMLQKIKTKLDLENKNQQITDLVQQSETSNLAQLVQEHLADQHLTLKSLAHDLGFSPSHFSVIFKKEIGIPFQDYLIQERIKKAKLLLLTTDLKIYAIAEQVGFEDMNYFSQRFKQIVGMTPSQFKKGGQL
ncbi:MULTISPECIES: response regulator [unclassified Facklamia]|uniref:response regulator transcription factor n=1 Tax=Aerococcaceae TaxID=186827 RepID=UPI0013BD2BCB|nr:MULTISPECIES: response regulator [unclassified Facklamia]NEW64765.1 response regulator [Facklamia sp. 252]NEW68089.1 response regulator [Facklamia sp. 253]